MSKRTITSLLIFFVYCIPYAFLLMYFHWKVNEILFYLLQLLSFAALGWHCGRTKRIPLAVTGSLVSCALSFLLACRYLWDESYAFAPLGITGMVLFLFTYTLAVQILIWRKQRGEKEAPLVIQFFEILAMLLVPTVVFLFGMLLLPHIL